MRACVRACVRMCYITLAVSCAILLIKKNTTTHLLAEGHGITRPIRGCMTHIRKASCLLSCGYLQNMFICSAICLCVCVSVCLSLCLCVCLCRISKHSFPHWRNNLRVLADYHIDIDHFQYTAASVNMAAKTKLDGIRGSNLDKDSSALVIIRIACNELSAYYTLSVHAQ